MRADALGLFWQDVPATGSRGERGPRVLPPTPDTGWTVPAYLPDLSAAKVISLDCETKDPELLEKGPGWARGVGHIVGMSVGADGGGKWYFPIRHEVEPELNMDPELVLRWARDQFGRPHQPKVGANITYDIGWLKHEGVNVAGRLHDVQYAEALLDERARVALEVLGQKYLGTGKDSSLLYKWMARAYGGKPTSDQRKNIYRTSPRLVGPYAESDAELPLQVIERQWPLLAREGLLDLYDIECRLINLMVAMRFAGVRVDPAKAEELYVRLDNDAKEANRKLSELCGCQVNVDAAETVARGFDNLGLPYPKTAKGKPSFTKDWLEALEHPVGALIREERKLSKLADTFVKSYILGANVNGRVYGQFHQLRGDGNGARSGRFSGSTPNLQNLPSRDEELAPLVRGLFLPDLGHKQWRRYDYSQIEYRFLVHYAIGPGSDEARARYIRDPSTDYHEWTLDLVAPVAGWDISTKDARKWRRKPLKTINFGLIYGMGKPKLARSLGLSRKDGNNLFAAYHRGVPFAKETMDAAVSEANRTGIIRTFLNRISRFDLWVPQNSFGDESKPALPYEAALRLYGYIERAFTHKALNRRLQGSAADLMKMAMLLCWESGVFSVTGVPRLTVHDELDFSDPGGKAVEEAFAYIKHTMENALTLRVPVIAECEVGPDWGHCA